MFWTEPRDLRFEEMPAASNAGAGLGNGSRHAGGSQAVYADGSVRFLPDTTPPDTLRSLLLGDDGGPEPGDVP